MHNFNSIIVKKGQLLPGIHGLRGIAALTVILYHLRYIAGLAIPDSFDFIERDFGFGVHLFFIISAFSLMYSTEPKIGQMNWIPAYLLKRFFRIAPLFYLMLVYEIVRQKISYGVIVSDFKDIFLNLTFFFGFDPASSMVRAGWSVGVEMIFYVAFPVLILTIRNVRSAFVFLLLTLMASYFVRSVLHMQYIALTPRPEWEQGYFSFASNMCFFAMGIYAYYVSRLYKESILATRIISSLAIIIIGGLLFFGLGTYLYVDSFLYSGGRGDIIMWGLGLMTLCIWQSMSPSRLIANAFFEYLGERSFSIYLLHPPIIIFSTAYLVEIYAMTQLYLGSYAFFVCALLIVALVLVFAEITYRFIEVPGIQFGRKFIMREKRV